MNTTVLREFALKQTKAILLAMRPALAFLASQWWLHAFTAYYLYAYGAQYNAYRHSFDALAAAYISLLTHMVPMMVFEFSYQGWKRHSTEARIVYIVVFYDLHACFTFPFIFSLLESRWGYFDYFNGSSDGSWAMCFMLFMAIYSLVGVVAGVVAVRRRLKKMPR